MWKIVPVDFLTSVPTGGDVYVVAHILHDRPDDESLAILRGCAAAIVPGARLVVVEQVPLCLHVVRHLRDPVLSVRASEDQRHER